MAGLKGNCCKAFRKKVKAIVNNSNYGAKVKAQKLAPIVRGWRNYHRFCKMDGSRNSLYHIQNRAFKVFNKETKQHRYSCKKLLDKAFPAVSYSENKHINVQGEKSPYDGDIVYWSERNSKLYDDMTSKALKIGLWTRLKQRKIGIKRKGIMRVSTFNRKQIIIPKPIMPIIVTEIEFQKFRGKLHKQFKNLADSAMELLQQIPIKPATSLVI